MKQKPITRVLAVDVRASRMGFAVFETPCRLLDWGVRVLHGEYPHSSPVARLLRAYKPSVLAVRKIKAGGWRDTPGGRTQLRELRSQARRFSTLVTAVSETALKKFFLQYGKSKKYEIASLVATSFPEIAWKLPPRRKFWNPEDWRMTIFDAAALGLVFLDSQAGTAAVRQLLTMEPFRRSPADV